MVIYGKHGHAEVIVYWVKPAKPKAVVFPRHLRKLDLPNLSKENITLYSQTTKKHRLNVYARSWEF